MSPTRTWTRGFDCNGRLGPDEGTPSGLSTEPHEHLVALQREPHRSRRDRHHDRLRHPRGPRPIPRAAGPDLLARAVGGCHRARHLLASGYVELPVRRGESHPLPGRDAGDPTRNGSPGGSNVMTRSVTGSVTSIAVWSEPTDDPPFPATPARNPGESVFVRTSAGYLYAFAASDLSPMSNRSFGAGVTVRMASAPMNPPTNPSYSPALTEDGQRLFVNAGDWQSFYSLNGTLAWTGLPVITPWTSAPVVSLPSILADGSFGELVYAASDDGWLFARKVATGASYVPWETSPTARLHPTLAVRTIPVMETVSQQDRGPLSSPFIDSTTVYVTSRTGILYSIARDAVGTLSAGTVKWRFVDKVLQERGFQFTAPPVLAIAQRIIFGVGVDSKGTPDPSDDQGIVYSLSEVGDLLWRKDFDGALDASPSIWTTQVGSQLNIPNVWLGTGKGWVYAISSTGKYLAPLPPGTYPSGNQYLWGTDLQGRDIFSQFIWGSRIALIVGFSVALLTVGIGLVVGLVAGYLGRKTDILLMRFTDVILVLPLQIGRAHV